MWFPKQLQSNRKIRVRLWKLSLRFASVLCFSRSTGLQSRPAAVHLATYLTSGSNSSGLPGVRLFLHFGSFQAWILIMNSNVSLFGPKNRDEMTKNRNLWCLAHPGPLHCDLYMQGDHIGSLIFSASLNVCVSRFPRSSINKHQKWAICNSPGGKRVLELGCGNGLCPLDPNL